MKRSPVALALASCLVATPALADALTAEQIAARALNNNTFSTSNARAEVELEVSKQGKVIRQRRISTKIKRTDDEVRSFVEFMSPAEVAGTKFLSVEPNDGEADQFIYLPAFKKVKRVVGSQRDKSFMGTDFSYSDLDGRRVDDATWVRKDDAVIGGQPTYVVEGTPKKANESYGRMLIWVHQTHLIPMRIDFFEKDGTTVKKRFSVKRLEKKDERWVATDSTMATVTKHTETRLKIMKIDFDAEIPAEELTRRALER